MIRNLRRSYWFITSFLKKHLGRIAIVALVTILTLAAIPQLINRLPSGKPNQKIGRVGQFTLTTLPQDIQRLISSGLTDITPQGTATPALALKWDITDDGQSYTFTLKDNLFWHDGRPFQAADVTYNLPDTETNILSSHTLQFKLKEPFSPFPTILTTPLFRQTKSITKILKRSRSDLVGIGSHQVTQVKKRGPYLESLTLEASTEKRTYKFYTTETAAILGFKLGETNSLENIIDPSPLSGWKNISLTPTIHLDRYVAVFFNTQDSYLSDKNFRQALSYAIPDKPSGELRALNSIHPQSWAYNPQVKDYAPNLDRAKQLISDISQEEKDFSPSLRLDTTLAYLSLAEKIKASWEKLGVTTDVRVITFPPPDFQALLAVHQIPPDPDQYTFWHSTQTQTNLTRLQNPKIDKLLEDGRKTLDPAKRKEIYQDFQRFLLEESPAAFLFYQTTYTISRK